MINEIQFNNIVGTNFNFSNLSNFSNLTNFSKIKKPNSFYNSLVNISNKFTNSSKLKTVINYIYNNYDIPKESFVLSLCYLSKYVLNCKKSNINIFDHNQINNYLLTSIIIANKQLCDNFNDKIFCSYINFDFDTFKKIQLDILIKLDWNTFISDNNYNKFKNFLEHYMD